MVLTRRIGVALLLWVLITGGLAGCGGEHTVPVPVEKMGPTAEPAESMALDVDARGYVNGVFTPGNTDVKGYYHYPVSYTGAWDLIQTNARQNWFLAMSVATGSRVDIVGTMTRVIFDFWDHRQYADAGRVSFWLDGTKVGEFDLARTAATGQAIMDYMVYTGKTTLATVSMRLESGRAVIAGYRFIFPPIMVNR